MSKVPQRDQAIELLRGLVSIPSLSGEEEAASRFLIDQMRALGYQRAFVDEAGNAVGEMGGLDAPNVVVLLGHIDTVAGALPVRLEETEGSQTLYGRGSVDAKGPLATFTLAAARLAARGTWPPAEQRVVVVGAVEEEAASSKGARFVRDRFNGGAEPVPKACIIGEPSRWNRVTLGYKGRLLIDFQAEQEMAHTAGPDPGMATAAVELWNRIAAWSESFNENRARPFDQVQPSLRQLATETDDGMVDRVRARVGLRLPLDLDPGPLVEELLAWSAERSQAEAQDRPAKQEGLPRDFSCRFVGPKADFVLRFWGYEKAWRSGSQNPLVRSFLEAIRHFGEPGTRPRFVVKTGTSDLNVVAPVWRCPILAYGPGDSSLDHTPHEHLDLDEYWRSIQVLERALQNLSWS